MIVYYICCFQAERAMQRGATAIIFDTTDHPEASTEVYIQICFDTDHTVTEKPCMYEYLKLHVLLRKMV